MTLIRTMTLLAALLMAACAAEPPPWQPPPQPRAYWGRPTSVAISANGNAIAVVGQGTEGYSLAVLDGSSGKLVTRRALPGESVEAIALSADGTRLLTLRRCYPYAHASACGHSRLRLVESTAADLADQTTFFADGWQPQRFRLVALGYEAEDVTRPWLLGTTNFLRGVTMPLEETHGLRLLRVDRSKPDAPPYVQAEWQTDRGVVGSLPWAPIAIVTSTTALFRAANNSSQIYETVFAKGSPPTFSVSAPSLQHARTARLLGLRGDRYFLDRFSQLPQLRLAQAGAAQERLLTVEANVFTHLAITPDGGRAAVIAQPLRGDDPQPILYVADATSPDMAWIEVMPTDALAAAGLGRTRARSAMDNITLIRRLRLLFDQPASLADRSLVERVLGLQAIIQRDGPDGDNLVRLVGDLADPGNPVTLWSESGRGAPAATLKLTLPLAGGPCLQVPIVQQALGDPNEPDHPFSHPIGPFVQRRWGLTYKRSDGSRLYFQYGQQLCARSVHLTQPALNPPDRGARP